MVSVPRFSEVIHQSSRALIVHAQNLPRTIILREYRGRLECYPVTRRPLLFYAKMDHGTCKTVRIELSRILERDRSSNLLDRNIT